MLDRAYEAVAGDLIVGEMKTTDVALAVVRRDEDHDSIGFNPPTATQQFGVRVLDLVIGFTAAVACAPCWMLIVFLMAVSGSRPIFFSQTRVGRNGVPFRCWKFRSMVVDADSALADFLNHDPDAANEWVERQKLSRDPRITTMGRFLRRFDLDEIPQLFNVIKGDMSIVGPRPILPEERWRYGEAHQVVTLVKPGMTGVWQTSGRNDVTYAERVKMDIHYAVNRRVWSDLAICVRTASAVLRPGHGRDLLSETS